MHIREQYIGSNGWTVVIIVTDPSFAGSADGTALLSHGLTTVLVNVFGPREPRLRSQSFHDRTNINVEVGITPFSTSERRKRNRGDKYATWFSRLICSNIATHRRVLEFAAAIRDTFEPVILAHLYPRTQIDIYVQVIQQDGGTTKFPFACILDLIEN